MHFKSANKNQLLNLDKWKYKLFILVEQRGLTRLYHYSTAVVIIMSTRMNRTGYFLIKLMFFLAKCYLITTFLYQKDLRKIVPHSKKAIHIKIFLRITSIVIFVVYVYMVGIKETLFYSINLPIRVMFTLLNWIMIFVGIMIVRSQLNDSVLFSCLINKSMFLLDFLKQKIGSHAIFTVATLTLIVAKILSSICMASLNMPVMIKGKLRMSYEIPMFPLLWLGNLFYFNFAFLGLLTTAIIYRSTNVYLTNLIFSIKQEYSKFKVKRADLHAEVDDFIQFLSTLNETFKLFLRTIESHLLLILVLYTVNIAAGLSFIFSNTKTDSYGIWNTIIYQMCCLIDVFLFNLVAALVEFESDSKWFNESDIICLQIEDYILAQKVSKLY